MPSPCKKHENEDHRTSHISAPNLSGNESIAVRSLRIYQLGRLDYAHIRFKRRPSVDRHVAEAVPWDRYHSLTQSQGNIPEPPQSAPPGSGHMLPPLSSRPFLFQKMSRNSPLPRSWSTVRFSSSFYRSMVSLYHSTLIPSKMQAKAMRVNSLTFESIFKHLAS